MDPCVKDWALFWQQYLQIAAYGGLCVVGYWLALGPLFGYFLWQDRQRRRREEARWAEDRERALRRREWES